MTVYSVRSLSKTYPGQSRAANDDISFDVQPGEIFGLLGDNGAGKSTLVKQMANLLRPSAGTITLFDKPIDADPMHVPLRVGYMPQDGRALNNLTVSEALYFTAHLRGRSRREAQAERKRLIEIWGLGDLRDKATSRLSGGQKRLLQLAVAMAGQPPVLILDEPTNELAPQRRRHVWETLRAENSERGTTIIFITHDALEAEKIIQRVGILGDGRLLALGMPSELKRQIDRQLRLELFFPPEQPPALPADFQRREIAPGRWLVYLERKDVDGALSGLQGVDDFRLYSATLEDLYLSYTSE